MTTPSEPIPILVAGDVVADRHFYHAGDRVIEKPELGGAVGLFRLLRTLARAAREVAEQRRLASIRQKIKASKESIKEVKEKLAKEKLEKDKKELEEKKNKLEEEIKLAGASIKHPPPVPQIDVHLSIVEPRVAALPQSHNAYAVWAPVKRIKSDKKEDEKAEVWRAARPMGYGKVVEAKAPFKFELKKSEMNGGSVLVLDDGGFDFRHGARQKLWCLPTGTGAGGWIVLKMSRPVVQGELWYALKENFNERLICIVSAEELRREKEVGIGTGMSWEQTVEDIGAALKTNTILKGLDTCRHLIVTFSVDGALWIDCTRPNSPQAKIIFDPARAEGEWGEPRIGRVFGYLSCMAAAVAYVTAEHVAAKEENLDLGRAICSGLSAMRDLHDMGHGAAGAADALPDGYPVIRLAQVLAQAKSDFAVKPIRWPRHGATTPPWMMVSEEPNVSGDAASSIILGLSRQIVIKGYSALRGTPHARFGKLVTADRSEIEALRGLRRLMRDYQADAKADKPLSIGVFGPPGAGKSFGVEQLANEVFGAKAWIVFNLSQFEGPADLVGAFHQVRDKVLGGITPVVFWDEFDSRAHFWLQYLLAPMQDGRFQDDQLNHSIGKCVFVFAGGTSFSFKEFMPEPSNVGLDAKQTAELDAKQKLVKGPDFKSRLDGYYDVLGPNQRTLPGKPNVLDTDDICKSLRRGLFIRAKLGGESEDRVDIDPDLLDALLKVGKYTHGARSLEKLVQALRSSPDGSVRRSSLPPLRRLAVHVDEKEFNTILDRNSAYRQSQIIDQLAEWIHESWRKGSGAKAKELDVAYRDLAPVAKEDNRAAARRIPEVLALVGLGVAKQGEAKSVTQPNDTELKAYINDHIELLAEAEHDGWKAQREKNGWRYGEPRNDKEKIHPLLIAYNKLPDPEKKKDRDSVRNYPDQIRGAGLAIVWLVTPPDQTAAIADPASP